MISKSKIAAVGLLAGALSSVACISLIQSFTHTSGITIAATVCGFTLFYYFCFKELIRNFIEFKKMVRRPLVIVFTVIFSLTSLYSLKGSLQHLSDNSWAITLFVWIGAYLTIMAVVLAVLYTFILIHWVTEAKSVSRWRILWFAVPCLFVWGVYLAAFFPGGMTPDSLSHWRQIHTLEFSNWHPVFYTWFMMLITGAWHSPAATAIGQIIVLALIFGYAMYSFEKHGLNKKLLWITAILFALSPVNSVFSIMIWKDVLYSSFLLLFTVVMINIVVSNGNWLVKNRHLLLLSLAVIGIIFIRNNGLPIFLVMALLLMLTYRRYFKKLIITAAAVCTVFFLFTGPVFSYLEVKPADPNEALSIPTQQFARVIAMEGRLSDEQTRYLNQILPLNEWRENYNPYITDRIKFLENYNREVIYNDYEKYFKTWYDVISNNFEIAVDAYLKQTSLVWQINEPEHGYTSLYSTKIHQPNEYGLTTQPLLPSTANTLTRWQTFTENHLKEFIWRPAVYTLLIILFSFASYLKNGWKSWLPAFPVLLNTGTILVGLPAQDFRYLFSNSMAMVMIGLFALLLFRSTDAQKVNRL
ncbi:DUF6020 family protein [Sediminibacillus albus]|uniref:Dolichyl-phosphate-mannose-protein mannosyltransferase n=1 Tax=Sediminibacillus albus TaxID=407036 RepID=A0A1G8ZHC7_9BACI|nr:DUF6020 family protein [Sediminibacillus albus]SDK14447.1 hypothetical protein SAMN05216243_2015 [Sediminibacillus albus]